MQTGYAQKVRQSFLPIVRMGLLNCCPYRLCTLHPPKGADPEFAHSQCLSSNQVLSSCVSQLPFMFVIWCVCFMWSASVKQLCSVLFASRLGALVICSRSCFISSVSCQFCCFQTLQCKYVPDSVFIREWWCVCKIISHLSSVFLRGRDRCVRV